MYTESVGEAEDPVDGFTVEERGDEVVLVLSSRYGTGEEYRFDRADAARIARALLLVADHESALMRVEALCARWDQVTKGESPTTATIREAIRGDG